MMSETLPLTQLPRRIRVLTDGRATYQRLYRMILDGDLPAKQNDSGRWFVDADDVAAIAEKLGLKKGN